MVQNIFVGVMCVVVAAVAVWGWWLENGPEKMDPKDIPESETDPSGQEESAETPQPTEKRKK